MPQFLRKLTILTTQVIIRPDAKQEFVDWQGSMNAAITAQPGFVSLEFLSPTENNPGWCIVQRFNQPSDIESWQNSEQWKSLKEQLSKLSDKDGIREAIADPTSFKEGVTEVIITEVSPEHEQAYRNWTAKVHQIEAKFPGFKGVCVQSPSKGQGRHWITLLQFDTMENLDRWLSSPERQKVLSESSPMITSLESHRVISPYAGWFANIAKVGELPSVWKQTMLVLLVLFPIVMVELKFLKPLTEGLNSSLGTFIGNAISVILISFPMMPVAIWFLSWWLTPPPGASKRNTIIGTLLMIVLYLIEITVFWHFL